MRDAGLTVADLERWLGLVLRPLPKPVTPNPRGFHGVRDLLSLSRVTASRIGRVAQNRFIDWRSTAQP